MGHYEVQQRFTRNPKLTVGDKGLIKTKKYILLTALFELPEKFNGGLSEAVDLMIGYYGKKRISQSANERIPPALEEKAKDLSRELVHHKAKTGEQKLVMIAYKKDFKFRTKKKKRKVVKKIDG